MRARDDLFKLVKSLSRTEKRYFTLDAQKSGAKGSNYLTLFRKINEMRMWDESKLKKNFSNLSTDKAYLYEAILRSMRDYRSSKSIAARIKEHLLDARFLYERGLYDQCKERFILAKDLAFQLSDSLTLLEINKEERKLRKETNIRIFKQDLSQFKQEKKQYLEALEEEFFYLDIYDELSLQVIEFFQLSKEKDKQQLIDNFKQDSWRVPYSPHGVHRYYQANALYYHLLGKNKEAAPFFRKTVEWWDEYPSFKREEFFRYIIDLNNLLAITFATRQFDQVEKYLNRLEGEKAVTFHEEELIFQKRIGFRLGLILEKKDWTTLESIAKEVEEGISRFSLKEQARLTILIQTALAFYYKNEFETSRTWLKKIWATKDLSVRRDIQKGVRILNLLIAGEIDDLEMIEGLVRSYSRFFNTYFRAEELTLEKKFIRFYKSVLPFPLDRRRKKEAKEFLERNASTNRLDGATMQIIRFWIENL